MKSFPAALLFSTVLLVMPASAQDHVTAINASALSDYLAARRQLEVLAERGDARAAHELGLIYNEGHERKQDFEQAVSWFARAAAQEYAPAEYSLGVKYEKGQGVPQSFNEAVAWYHRSAAQGNAAAQYRLGRMYVQGHGVESDYVEAVKWFDLAAAQGLEDAGLAREAIVNLLTPQQAAQVRRAASAQPAPQAALVLPEPKIETTPIQTGRSQSSSNGTGGSVDTYWATNYRRTHEVLGL
ncbi:MAG: sel1 repeat family protein [Alphaproteobacteria bacterium]|nr:sel1 repeat family protein [Alphaproteobacteria bacterium]